MSDSKIKVFDVVNDKFVPLPVSSNSSLIVTDTTLESDDINLAVTAGSKAAYHSFFNQGDRCFQIIQN